MGKNKNATRLVIGLIGLFEVIWAVAATAGSVADAPQSWRPKVQAALLTAYDGRAGSPVARVHKQLGTAGWTLRFNDQGAVEADVYYDCGGQSPKEVLVGVGVSVGSAVNLTPFCVIEGWVPLDSLPQIAAVAAVTRVVIPSYAVAPRLRQVPLLQPAAGSPVGINANGVKIIRADQFVSQTGTGGAGVTVGVQSAGVSSVSTIQARGELPAVQVLKPSDTATAQVGDEGTALLEEIHAVAPSAGLMYCGPHTFVDYTACLNRMVAAGATVLVDDIIFPEQDLLASNSSQVQGIEQLLAANSNVALFTAAGNYNGSYWEGNYTPVTLASLGLSPLSCPASGGQTDLYVTRFGTDSSQRLSVSQSSSVPVALAWADPPDHNASKFDVYWVNHADSAKSGCLPAGSATDNQVSQNVTLYSGNYDLYIATPDASAAGKFLKLWIGGDGLTTLSKPTNGAVVTPQAFASGSVTVGAVNGSDGVGSSIESFSSLGPISIIFPQTAQIQAPVLVAPDGINVDAAGTLFANNLFPDGNFYGTSAAVPNAGAVAALIRGAFPSLNASQLVSALQDGAVHLGSNLPDAAYGYGRVDAVGALATFPVPTITALPDSALNAGSSGAVSTFTVSGTGPLHFKVQSTNTALIPASLVAAGSPGVNISPADCGAGILTCSLSVTAADGVSDAVKVTVSVLDGANRPASSAMTVTVTGNQTPPPPPSNPTTSGGGGGGKLDWVLLASLLSWMGLKRRRALRLDLRNRLHCLRCAPPGTLPEAPGERGCRAGDCSARGTAHPCRNHSPAAVPGLPAGRGFRSRWRPSCGRHLSLQISRTLMSV